MDSDRILQLDGVHNFRDFGGYALAGGGWVKRRVLWRSGQHHEASNQDLAAIAALGLTGVFDLRSDRERASHPCRRPEGFIAQINFVSDGSADQAPHLAAVSGMWRDAATMRENMRKSYMGMPYRRQLGEMLRQYFTDLASGQGPSLVNCMAGKDRTGFAVAMVQIALGVHHDDVLADYLLTNSAGDTLARIAAGGRSVATVLGDIDPEVLTVIMGVEAEYLETALGQIRADHGSVEAYQAEVLGVDAALKERLLGALSES